MTHPLNDNIEALQQWSKTGELPGAPEKKKAGKLKFSVSNAAIRQMAASTLENGGLEVQNNSANPAPMAPATTAPRAPAAPAAGPRRGGLSGAFNAAARGGSNNDNLSAMIKAGEDIVAPTRPRAKPAFRPRKPSFSF